MKINDLLKVVDEGWIRKPVGFRVRFQTRKDGDWVTDTMPGGNESLLDSDVVGWRSAWKLLQAAESGAGEYVNITVVDDRGEPFCHYATGRVEVYNPRLDVTGDPLNITESSATAEDENEIQDDQPGSAGDEAEVLPSGDQTSDK